MGGRPDVSMLEPVEDGDIVFRVIRADAYQAQSPPGSRIQISALQTKECEPAPTNYGASVFAATRLADDIATLFAAMPKWRTYPTAKVPVLEVRKLGVDVRFSPDDCDMPELRSAHASIIGITRQNRPSVIRLLERYLLAPGS